MQLYTSQCTFTRNVFLHSFPMKVLWKIHRLCICTASGSKRVHRYHVSAGSFTGITLKLSFITSKISAPLCKYILNMTALKGNIEADSTVQANDVNKKIVVSKYHSNFVFLKVPNFKVTEASTEN